jgi:polyhydroxybutyrate depolymerase
MGKKILILLFVMISVFLFNQIGIIALQCGNGICEDGENSSICSKDCCSELYTYYKDLCLQKGWQEIIVDVDGLHRQLLWKGPEKWENGSIIVMHGGGGTHSNACANIPLGEPMVNFSELAISQGFAVFSLDSTYNLVTDSEGRLVGKRWDCNAQDRPNIDLPFIEKVIKETIPSLRPEGSSKAVFITGISNGGFMTTLAATHFGDNVAAFAPVAAGDPYGTYFDMGTHPPLERECAPGVFRDIETNILINQVDACVANDYPNEKQWVTTEVKPVFKQFHHRGDGACDFSCMGKAQGLLVDNGYPDEGPFILDDGGRSVSRHFWQEDYNQPILDFFAKYTVIPGDYYFSIQHDGRTRTFYVHVPPGYNPGIGTPVVMAFHGGGGTGEAMATMSQLNEKSDIEGFIAVYPDGVGLVWNAGICCPYQGSYDIDDVGFVEAMLQYLEQRITVDPNRIYATGISNGGMMSYRLACELSDRIAAIAPVSTANTFENCNPSRPVSVMHIEGTDDQCVPYEGSDECGGCLARYICIVCPLLCFESFYFPCPSAEEETASWVQRNGCSNQPRVTYQDSETVCNTYGPCNEGTEITLCTIEGGGHTWPGGTLASEACNNPNGTICLKPNTWACEQWKNITGEISDFPANDRIWEFFRDHSKKIPCVHQADRESCDGQVDIAELMDFVDKWKRDSTTYPMNELMKAIELWSTGGS